MIKYLKAEYTKMLHSKHLIFLSALLFLYTLLVLLLYYADGLSFRDVFINFNDEYFLLFLLLSIFWGNSSVGDEINFGTDVCYPRNKFILFKIFFMMLYIVNIFVLSLVIFIFEGIFIYKELFFDIWILNALLKSFPLYLFWGLLSMLLSICLKKSNISLLCIICAFFFFEYIKGRLYNFNALFKYFFIFHLNMNKILVDGISLGYSVLINMITIFFVIYLILIIYNKRS